MNITFRGWALALLGVGLLLSSGAKPKPADAPASVTATTQAVERLIRSTRRGGEPRAPFQLQDGPADPAPEQPLDDIIETAILKMQDEDYAGAIPLLEKALKETPTMEAVWEALGWSYYRVGREPDAEQLWKQYEILRPESPKIHSLLAQLALLRNDWREADRQLKESLRWDPTDYDLRYWYAQNMIRLGRLQPAIDILEKLLVENDLRYDVKIDLARLFTLVQRYEEALDLWTDIVDELPDNLDFRTEYARAHMLVGNFEEADEQARRVLTDDPSRWPAMNVRADIAEISGEPKTAVALLRNLIDAARDDEVRAQLHVRLGARLVKLHGHDSAQWPLELALEQYRAAIQIDPENVSWLNQYAETALTANHPERARHIAEQVLKEFNPYNHRALRVRFESLLATKNYPAAEAALHELYERYQPNDPYRFFDLARLEIQQGRYANALDALDRLEEAGNRGSVLTLLYHGLTESEWMALTSTRRLREQLMALREAGFTFISPFDIPSYLNSRAGKVGLGGGPRPWLARQVDQIHYAFTGESRVAAPEEIRPEKVVAITFDDGLRSSLNLATPIAEDMGLTLGMFILTSIEELNAPTYASWDELKLYRDSGLWEIGSHLLHAHKLGPASPEPGQGIFPLPNRLWLPERDRLETMREWTRRVQAEFRESRARIETLLGVGPREPLAVAYPFGEIGQEEGSNVARILNPIRTLLDEASREYQMGFVLGRYGYTLVGANPLTIHRYEPPWDMEAPDLVEFVMMNHPVMMARRLRAEIATLMDRPYLADRQIQLLRRDGYPQNQLQQLIAFTQNRSASGLAAADLDTAEGAHVSRKRLRPSNAYLAAAYHENQANVDILQRLGELRAGMNLTPKVGVEALYQGGTIQQTVKSNFWYTINQSETFTTQETRTENVNGQTSVTRVDTQTTTVREVQTNRVDQYRYRANLQELRGALTIRVNDTATLIGTLGGKWLTLKTGPNRPEQGDEFELVGSLVMAWRPFRALQLAAQVDHDIVPSARIKMAYNSIGVSALWKVSDGWDVAGQARYFNYRDKNAMAQLSGSSFWLLFERLGLWGGLEASTYTMDEKSDLYWSPYWDNRYAGVLRLRRAYLDYFFQFDVRLGRQSEKARSAEKQAWRNLKAKADHDGNWYPGDNPDADWATYIGLGGTYRQRIWRHLDLIGDLSVNFLREYSEHNFTLGLQYNF